MVSISSTRTKYHEQSRRHALHTSIVIIVPEDLTNPLYIHDLEDWSDESSTQEQRQKDRLCKPDLIYV